MLTYYKLRITTNDELGLVKFFDRYSDRYLYCNEVSKEGVYHIHAYFESDTPKATIRAAIRRKWGDGNRNYSLKELDEELPLEYVSYCCKDGDYHYKNIDKEFIDDCLSRNEEIQREIKEKKKSRKTTLQQIEHEYFQDVDEHNVKNDEYITKEYVVDSVLNYYKTKNVLIRRFMIVSLCQTLCIKYVNSYERQFREKILDEL